MAGFLWIGKACLVAEVIELERLAQFCAFYQLNHCLQVVARFTGDTYLLALNLSLNLDF